MALFDQIASIVQFTFQIFFILYTIAVLYGLYVFLPKFGAQLITQIPSLLANGVTDQIGQLLSKRETSDKMRELGAKGNLVKAEQSALVQAIAQEDPVKAFVLPWLEKTINSSDSGIPKYLRGTVSDLASKMITKTPVNFTEQLVPRIVSVIDERLPQLKLSERLKELDQLQKVEKVAD